MPLTDIDELYEAQFGRLVTALRLSGSDRATAEDVVQEAFVRVLLRWDRIASPAAYLYRTAFRLRSRGRFRSRRRGEGDLRVVGPVVASPESAAEHRADVEQVLSLLTSRQRECAVLVLYLGCSTEEAAEVLGVRASTVRVHLHGAREAARARFLEIIEMT